MFPAIIFFPWNEIFEFNTYSLWPSWYLYASFKAPSFASAPELEKYDIFKNFVTDFKTVNKLSSEELVKFQELNINFKNNVKENFKNTVEFCSIIYKTNDSNETNFSENFGYLIDLNRFPIPQYHGQLISDYQIKLIRNKKKYLINFLTSSDFTIKGFQILSSNIDHFWCWLCVVLSCLE